MKRPIIFLLLAYVIAFICYEHIIFDYYFTAIVLIASFFIIKLIPKRAGLILTVFIFAYFRSMTLSDPIKLDGLTLNDVSLRVDEKNKNDFSNVYLVTIKSKRKSFKAQYSTKTEYQIGDILYGNLSFELPNSKDNFGVYSYRQYLKSKKVFISVDNAILSDTNKDYLLLLPRRYLQEFIRSNVSSQVFGQGRDFAQSVVLGQKSMQKELLDAYGQLGISHILAVSGLHISILISFFEYFGRLLGFRRELYSVFILLVLLFYGYVIAFPISLIRALLMYFVRFVAIYWNKIQDKLNSIYLALLLCLFINPYYLYSPALYFSFFAIFSVMYLSDFIKANLRIKDSKYDAFISGISIIIGMMPIQLVYSSNYNLLSFVINFFLLPLAFIPVLASFIVAFSPINLFIPALILEGSIGILNRVVTYFSKINMLNLSFSNIGLIWLGPYYLFLMAYLNLYRTKKAERRGFWIKSFLMVALLLSLTFTFDRRIICRINFIDVGQGDAILFRTRNYRIMLDLGGNFFNQEKSAEDLTTYLFKQGVKSLDALFLSHDDLDHVGNFKFLKKKMRVNKIYSSSKFENIDLDSIKVGQVFKFDDLELEVLSGDLGDNKNESSMVIKASIFEKSILFMADIEDKEIDLAQNIDVLKVSHHGSDHASSKKFLQLTSPDLAIISVGQNNKYGHPSRRLLEDLDSLGIDTYLTSRDGNVELVFDDKGYFLDTFYKKHSLRDLLLFVGML